jgi:hypothetical protein
VRVILVWWIGCLAPDEFATHYAEAECARLAACDREGFDLLFARRSCQEALASDVADVELCLAEHCRYHRWAAQRCVHDVEQALCSDIDGGSAFAACDDIWQDCDGSEAECREPVR